MSPSFKPLSELFEQGVSGDRELEQLARVLLERHHPQTAAHRIGAGFWGAGRALCVLRMPSVQSDD